MSALNPDSVSAAFKSLPTSFINSLTSALDGEATAGNDAFSDLLSQIASAETQSGAASVSADTQDTPTSTSTSASFPDTSALKQVLDYIRSQEKAAQGNKQSSQNTPSSSTGAADNSNTSSSNTSATAQSTSTDTTGNADDTDQSGTASNTTADSSDKPPDAHTLALALTEMQQLMQWLAQHLSSAVPAAGAVVSASAIKNALSADPSTDAAAGTASDASTGTDSKATPTQSATDVTDPAQDTSSTGATADSATQLADALAGFLALMQTIDVQLMTSTEAKAPQLTSNLNAAKTIAATNTDTTNTTTDLSPYAEIKAGLEKLEAALEYEITGNAKQAANDAAESGASSNSAAATTSSSTSATSATTAKTTSVDDLMASINPAAPTDAHLFKLFADIFGNTAQAAASAISSNLTATAGGGGGTDLNSDQSGDNGAASGNTSPVSNDPSSLLAGGAQPSNSLFSFASQLSAARASSTSTGSAAQILDQVALSIKSGIKNGDTQMSIQLSPEDLGRINVKLDISSEGKVQGTVVADNQSTLDQLLKDVRGLERALQEAGLSADPGSLQFSLGNQQQPGNTFAQSQGSGSSGNGGSGDGSSSDAGAVDAVSIPADAEIYYITPGGVNIKV